MNMFQVLAIIGGVVMALGVLVGTFGVMCSDNHEDTVGTVGISMVALGGALLIVAICIKPVKEDDPLTINVDVNGQIEVTEQAPAGAEDAEGQGMLVEIDGDTYALIDGAAYPVAS